MPRLKYLFASALILVFVLMGVWVPATNLNTDSINRVISSTSEEKRLEVLLSTAEKIIHRHPEQAIVYAERALLLAKERQDANSEAQAHLLLSRAKSKSGQYAVALDHLDEAHTYFQSANDSIHLVESFRLYGNIFTQIGDFKKSTENIQHAIAIAVKINNQLSLADLTRELGNVYFYFGERAIALDFFQKSLDISLEIKYSDGVARAYNNMGRIYTELGRYTVALDYLMRSLESKDKDADRVSYGNTLLNIGTVYLRTKEYQRAINYFEEARMNFAAVNNVDGTANALFYLGDAYFAQQRHNQAIAMLNQAWEIASSNNLQRLMVSISRALSNVYESIGDYRKAHEYLARFLSLRDTVYSVQQSNLLVELETRYKLNEKQRQIELLSKERALEESEKTRNRILITLLALVALLFFLLSYFSYVRFRYKSKANEKLLEEIDHRKRVEAQLNEYQEQLENIVEERTRELKVAKDRAEEADKLKTSFLTNISHEIRTPLNAIVGFSYLLTDKESTDEAKAEYVKIIKSNGEVLMNLINDILDISIIEAGQLRTKIKPVVVDDVLDELKLFFQQEIDNYGNSNLKLVTDYDDRCNRLVVNTDGVRLRQVMSNLLWNALKFTPAGQITLGYRLSGAEELIFFVKDTGLGIEADKHKVIFERFSKFTTGSETSLYSGTGLGLAICNELVEALGGKIWLDSYPGKGSTFYFTIPYKPNGELGAEPKLVDDKTIDLSLLKGKTILVAEDVTSNYKLIEAFLSDTELTILWAKDGVQAINLFRENPSVNLVLMDVQMPLLDGINALKNIRKLNQNIPVIINTAFYHNDEREKCFEAGCTDYMSKPIRKEDLLVILTQSLKQEAKF
ncbi:MAG: tetratricopeptide repeat protein [Bacteroidales bacterium]|nr:tetratricopeptide repeat protein [Bacteroidales bacterium]